jgi:hypothetical protein
MRKLRRICCVGAMALSAIVLPFAPAVAVSPDRRAARLLSFTLDKQEAAKGETVLAAYRLDRPAGNVTLLATTIDGAPVSFRLPQRLRPAPAGDSGTIAFHVPAEAGTLSPLLLLLNVDGMLHGSQPLLVRCDYPWFFAPRVERCPFAPTQSTQAVIQHFERGAMIWLAAAESVYVLYGASRPGDDNRLERFDDAIVVGSQETVVTTEPPVGRFALARRFEPVWQTATGVRRRLGWALGPELTYTACYGYAFGGGKSMRTYVTTPDDRLLEFDTYYAPTQWRELLTIAGQRVTITGCRHRDAGDHSSQPVTDAQ